MAEGDQGGGWWPERKPEPDAGSEREEEEPEAPSAKDGGSAAGDRPPELPKPPRGLASRERPKVASRYSLFVGLAFAVLVIVAVVNAIDSNGGGILGANPDARNGVPLPEFAVPDVRGPLQGDANVFQDDCDSSRNPCPSGDVRKPACEIRAVGAIRDCDLFDKPLAISFWFTRGGDCLSSQDAFDKVAGRRGGDVNFLSINVLDDRSSVEQIVRDHGWTVPVGHDRDGAVSNLLGVGVCPTIVLAYPGGIIDDAQIKPGNFTEPEIESLIDDLVADSARRDPAPSPGAGSGSGGKA